MFDFSFLKDPQGILEIIIVPLFFAIVFAFVFAVLFFLADILIVRPLREKYGEYTLIWKRSGRLKPKHLLGLRAAKESGFNPYYYERDHDRIIREKLEKGENILVCGNPLAGKTRAVFEAIKKAKNTHYVTVPNREKMERAEYKIPWFFNPLPSFRKRRVLILDDIDKFSQSERRKSIVGRFRSRNVIIVATCRSGPDYDRFSKDEISYIFGSPVDIPKLTAGDEKTIKKESGKQFPKRFDGNIGSLFMDIEGMRQRYKELGDNERKLLLAIKYLYELGVYRGKDVFLLPWIIEAARHKYKFTPDDYSLQQRLKALNAGGFVVIENEIVRIEEAYLDLVLEKIPISLDDFHGMTTALAADPEALHFLGNKAIGIGERVTDKAHLMKAAIAALQSALTKWTKTKDRYSYGAARNSLGTAYGRLSEVERPKENIVESIKSFKEAKKVFTHKEFPIQYAMTQNNLGVSYRGLAGLDDPAGNLKRAVDAYREALRVRTPDNLPIDYASTMENLGIAYATLAEHEEREKNFSLAEKAVEAALVIFRQQKMTLDIEKAERNLNKIKAARGSPPSNKKR